VAAGIGVVGAHAAAAGGAAGGGGEPTTRTRGPTPASFPRTMVVYALNTTTAGEYAHENRNR